MGCAGYPPCSKSAIRTSFLLLLGCLVPLSGAGVSSGRFQTLFLTDGLRTAYRLEHNLLIVGTDSVFADGSLLDQSQYILDYKQGTLVLLRRPVKWTPVRVSYRCVCFSGPGLRYRLHRVAESATESRDTAVVAAGKDSLVWTPARDIAVTGSKSVGFSVGGIEGSGINQATRLSVSGTVEGVVIEAELSDQSSPIPAEGTTREIEELDKIVIDLRGKNWGGSFGDVDLRMGTRGFGTVERKATGGLISARAGPGDFTFGYARPRGQFSRVVFQGEGGVQGPYVLAPDRRAAQIVTGSEKVYLNGTRMTRGWDADYTIDYSTGELVFTNKHIIDRVSRIEASFQYVTEAYERDDIIGSAKVRSGPLELGLAVFREGDDPNQGFEELTEEDRRYLAGIGSDTSKAWLEGGQYVGDSAGSYVKEADYYLYKGEKQGDYQVRFFLKGDSLGGYVYDDTMLAYRYVGAGLGDYVAQVRVALPERQELVHACAGYSRAGVFATGSGLFQRHLRNLFAQDGAAQQDGAFGIGLGWADERCQVKYQGRLQGDGFCFPGADSMVDFEHRWAGTEIGELRASNELIVSGRPADFVELTGEAGVLTKKEGGAVERYQARARLGWLMGETGLAGDESRHRVSLGPRIGWFLPKAGLTMLNRPEERSRVWSGGLGVQPVEKLRAGLEYRFYQADEPDSTKGMQKAEDGGLAQAEIDWNPGEEFRLETRLARQNRHYFQNIGQDWSQWLGNVATTVSPVAGVRVQADFSQSHRLVQLRDEVFRYVGPGNGEYGRDSVTGRYYYDPDGTYERILVAKGKFSQATERSVTAAAELSALSPVMLSGSYSQTSAATDTALLQNLRNYNLRFTVRALEPVLTGHVGTSGASSFDRTLAVTGKGSNRNRHYLEISSSRIPNLDLRLRLENSGDERRFSDTLVDYAESGWKAELEPVIGAWLGLEILLGLDYTAIEEPVSYPELGRFSVVAREAGVARGWGIGDRTRVRGSVGFVQRSASIEELPFDVALTRPLGWTPSAGLEINHLFSDILTATLQYRFSDRPDRASEHQLTGELRAYF